MVKWIKKYDRKWDCVHVNKCDVLVERNGELFFITTDHPEPEGDYKYVFVVDLLEGERFSMGRTYIPCSCQPERSKREDLFCENLALIESAVEYTHSDYCSLSCCDTCVSLSKIISEHKMRCSEHCGNTVRDK